MSRSTCRDHCWMCKRYRLSNCKYTWQNTLVLYMHSLLIELWAVWYFYWVCCSWALSTLSIGKSSCTLHAAWNIHVLYPWQPGAVLEDSGLSLNLRTREEKKEAEVYHHVLTVSSPQLQDTQNQARSFTWPGYGIIIYTGSKVISWAEKVIAFHWKFTTGNADICCKFC